MASTQDAFRLRIGFCFTAVRPIRTEPLWHFPNRSAHEIMNKSEKQRWKSLNLYIIISADNYWLHCYIYTITNWPIHSAWCGSWDPIGNFSISRWKRKEHPIKSFSCNSWIVVFFCHYQPNTNVLLFLHLAACISSHEINVSIGKFCRYTSNACVHNAKLNKAISIMFMIFIINFNEQLAAQCIL